MEVARDASADRQETLRFLRIVQAEDHAGLERLLQECRPRCLRQAQRLLGSLADAEDAVQNASVRLVREAARFDGSIAFGAWMGRLVQEAAIDLHRATRRQRRREHAVAQEPVTVPDDGEDESAEQLRSLVQTLPAELRTPLTLRYLEGLSQRDAAARMGISENLVAVRVHRAKQELRRRLAQSGVRTSLPGIERRLLAIGLLTHPTTVATGWAVRTILLVGAVAVLAALLAGGTWSLVRHPASAGTAAAPPLATAHPAVAAAPVHPSHPPTPPRSAVAPGKPALQRYVWHFDDGPPTDIQVVQGSWHFEPQGGLHQSGCMEVDTDPFYAIIDRPILSGPLKTSIQMCPRLPAQANYQVKVMWNFADYQYQLENYQRPPVIIPMDARHNNTRYYPIWAFLGADSIDQYSQAGRAHLDFMRATPSARLVLCTARHLRLDDLIIEQIPPAQVPDLTAIRHAIYHVPLDRRHGTTDLPGVLGADRQHPVRVEWGYPPVHPPLVDP